MRKKKELNNIDNESVKNQVFRAVVQNTVPNIPKLTKNTRETKIELIPLPMNYRK